MTLVETDPGQGLAIAGRVEAWASEDISAEVTGRVAFMVAEGSRLDGRWVEDGSVLLEGGVLARLDPTQYEVAVRAAEFELGRAVAQHEQVAPAKVVEAETELEQRRVELERLEQAFESGAAAPAELLSARSAHQVAESKLTTARAAVVDAGLAVGLAETSVTIATLNLEHTVIRAPFTGFVDRVDVIAGGLVAANTPIAHLVMMDPVKVRVTVSAGTAREIDIGDPVGLEIDDWPEPIRGRVSHKSITAESDSGTFTMTVVARNDTVPGVRDAGVKTIGGTSALMPRSVLKPDGERFVEERRVLREDDAGYFVWALDASDSSGRARVFQARRVSVVPSDARINYQGLFIGRFLADVGELTDSTPLALDPPADLQDGDRVQAGTERWIMRPGDIVRVTLDKERPAAGYYVPLRAITMGTGDDPSIYRARDGRAVRTGVRLGEVVGNVQRVEPVESEVDLDGALLIVEGAHYLVDGEAVSPAGEGG